jgi:tetratricopeptide (TPR) repeat protein
MSPQFQLLLQQGIQAFQNDHLDSANSILRKVLQIDSKNLPALHILGLIKLSQKNYKEGANLLSRASQINPNDASIEYNLAKALVDCGSDKESLPHHKKAVQLDPNNPGAWLNYGKAVFHLKHYDDALINYDQALNLKPDYAEVWLNKGNVLNELKRYDEALHLKPDYAEAYSNKGTALYEIKRYDEALKYYDIALKLKPDFAEPWANKGNIFHQRQLYGQAVANYGRALAVKPHMDWVGGDLLHIKMKICDWSKFDEEFKRITAKVSANEKIIYPFSLLALTDNAQLLKQSSQIYAQEKYPPNPILGPIYKRIKK